MTIMSILQEISLIQWILLGMIVFVLTGFTLLVNLRRQKPHSGEKARAQARINKKRDIDVPQPNGTEKNLDWLKGKLHFGTKMSWSATIIVVGVILWYKMPNTEIRFADVSSWSKEHWLQILIVYGASAGLIWLNADEKSAKVLQKVLVGLTATALVVLPMWSWMASPSSMTPSSSHSEIPLRHSDIPLASMPQSLWPKLVIPVGGKSEHIPVPPQMRPILFGEEFRVHCVYRDGHEIAFGKGENPCPSGDMPFVYATNEARGTNIVLYAYAPM